jgi:hypothetical protein
MPDPRQKGEKEPRATQTQTAFCERCDAMVEIADPIATRTNTGAPYIEGHCSACGAKVLAIAIQTKR